MENRIGSHLGRESKRPMGWRGEGQSNRSQKPASGCGIFQSQEYKGTFFQVGSRDPAGLIWSKTWWGRGQQPQFIPLYSWRRRQGQLCF